MKHITFPNQSIVPSLGQGTWKMGDTSSERAREVDALRYGMDLGMTLIDTAEMYADAELVVAQALKGRRDEAYVVSKVLPSNASCKGTIKACEKSLKRLEIACIDLYLLHWSGSYPIGETLEAFQHLVDQGKIASYGVSNFDVSEMEEASAVDGGDAIASNQVLYNLRHREIEWQLASWCKHRKIPIMAYSPIFQGKKAPNALDGIAKRHGVNAFQIALAWVLHQDNTIVIPKATSRSHIDENLATAEINLTDEDLKQIDELFPPPDSAVAVSMN